MGIMGELFGQNLTDEDGEEGSGEGYRPRFELDLDSGTIRLPKAKPSSSPDTL